MRYYIATMQHETQCTTYSPLVFVYKLDVYAPTRPQSCCRLPTGKSRHTPKHCKGDLKKIDVPFLVCVCVCSVSVYVFPRTCVTPRRKNIIIRQQDEREYLLKAKEKNVRHIF